MRKGHLARLPSMSLLSSRGKRDPHASSLRHILPSTGREGSHAAVTIMSISSSPRWKHPRVARRTQEEGERSRKSGKEKTLAQFSMPTQRDLLDLSIRRARGGGGFGKARNGVLDFENRTASSPPPRRLLLNLKRATGKTNGARPTAGPTFFRLFVITAMFFHALSFSLALFLSLSLFISVPNRTCRVSSVFLLSLSLSLARLSSLFSPFPLFILSLSLSLCVALRYLSPLLTVISLAILSVISPLVNCHHDNYCSFFRSPLRFPSYLLLPFPSPFFRYFHLSVSLSLC